MARMNNQGGVSWSTTLLIVVSLVIIYYVYSFLYSSVNLTPTVIVSDEITVSPTTAPQIPQPYEGGEYTFNTWVYVKNFRTNQNVRKPIFELQGTEFDTLFVGLGAQTNTLVVRTHNKDLTNPTSEGDILMLSDREAFLKETDASLTSSNKCDLPNVDLQRWVMITVVLSGRTIDVYMDGKLARSCVTSSYYKVDPSGVKPVILGGGMTSALDGAIAGMSVARFAMNPGQIYRLYSSGPKTNQTFISWLQSLVTGNQSV